MEQGEIILLFLRVIFCLIIIIPVHGSEEYDNCYVLTMDMPRDIDPKISRSNLCIIESGDLYDLIFHTIGSEGEVIKENIISVKLETSTKNINRFVHNSSKTNVKKVFTFQPSVMHGNQDNCFHQPYKQCGLMFTNKNDSPENGRLRYYKLPLNDKKLISR